MEHGERRHASAREGLAFPREPVLADDHLEIELSTPDDGHISVRIRERRSEVVARLLALGISTRTLMTLLPEWTELIGSVANEHAEVR